MFASTASSQTDPLYIPNTPLSFFNIFSLFSFSPIRFSSSFLNLFPKLNITLQVIRSRSRNVRAVTDIHQRRFNPLDM
ncbi:hypothetical protein L2E82_12112 [Cichorium intybus]|uniref:Uncharacterized protein n=1 Tax=Cichorium intybus TaxID=13427 RepID=A0ACB9GG73_CICIN|nr:hypothetical protein L2E82_12112 [Cichorium intybus]